VTEELRHVIVEQDKTMFTYVFLWLTARRALKSANERPEGSAYGFITTVVFSVFAVEAFFNHLGQRKIPYWEPHLERSLSISAKATLLNDRLLAREMDWSRPPYQSLDEGIRCRNAMAHGKTERILKTERLFMDPGEDPPALEPKWQRCCEGATAARILSDVEQIIHELHETLGHPWKAFDYMSTGSTSIRLPEGE
jgi:hypothetical protein